MLKLKKQAAGVLILVLAVTTLFSNENTTVSEAAKKPKLACKELNLKIGQKKKLKVSNAKKAKISWQTKSKTIIKFKKSGEYAITVQGLNKGGTWIVCKVRSGRKTYKLKCRINVKKASAPARLPATSVKPLQSATPTFSSPVASKAPIVPSVSAVPSASVVPSNSTVPLKSATPVPSSVPELASIKDTYADIFPNMGTCVSYGGPMQQLTSETFLSFLRKNFNSISLENEMKPLSIMGPFPKQLTKEAAKAKGYILPLSYTETIVPELTFDTLDKVMEAAYKNNLKLRGHTLVWHQQTTFTFFTKYFAMPSDMDNPKLVTPEVMDARMEFYIRTVMEHLIQKEIELTGEAGSIIYTWDVVNEYLHRKNDPGPVASWEDVYGEQGLRPDFVKRAFEIAYEVLKKYGIQKKVSLLYNDYDSYSEVKDIISLINFINQDEPEIICAGVGMQNHMTLAYPTIRVYEKALEAFAGEGYEIQITEMDIGYDEEAGQTEQDQAKFYRNIMETLVKAKKDGANITSVTTWGVMDTFSWRAETKPLLFSDSIHSPKPAFYSFLEAAKVWE